MTEPVEQGSEAWREKRRGVITASCFKHVVAVSKRDDTKPLEARLRYMRQLAFERISGIPIHEIHGRSLAWGKTHEGSARAEFEIRTGLICDQADFILHPEMPFVGCSPDALIGDDDGLEIKCPHNEPIHIGTWINGMPEEHIAQVQGCMFVTGRKQWRFLSFDPRLGSCDLALYHEVIPKDEMFIRKLESALWQFDAELQLMVKSLQSKGEMIWRRAA